MNCPKDQHELKDRALGETSIYKCPDCFGIWASKQAIVSLATTKQIHSLLELIESEDLPIMSLPHGNIRCPVDDTLMHLDVIHNIEIDLCTTCRGVWLDRGEFDSVAFREHSAWGERHEKPQDNFLQLFFDTVSYSSEKPDILENLILESLGRLKKLGLHDG